MSHSLYESEIEQITLDILREENGYAVLYGPDLSEGDNKEREYTEAVTGEYTISVTKVLEQAEQLADFWTKN